MAIKESEYMPAMQGWVKWPVIASIYPIDIRAIRDGDKWVLLVSGFSLAEFQGLDYEVKRALTEWAVAQAESAERSAADGAGGSGAEDV